MKKNSKLVKRIERCLSAIFCISALFACFTSTYAWFTASRAVQASAVEFTANEGPLPFSKIEIFKQDTSVATPSNPYCFSTKPRGTYTVSQTNGQNTISYDNSSSKDDDLDEYDNLLNGYQQCILYLFTVSDSISQDDLDNIFIQAKRNDKSLCLFLAKPDKITPKNPLLPSENALSNIISFETIPLSTALTPTSRTTTSGASASVYAPTSSSDTKTQFIDTNKLNPQGFLSSETDYSASENLFAPTKGTYSLTDSSKSLKQVAVIISYDDDLINLLYTINLGNRVLDNPSNSIGFKADWNFVI